jgi:two-component system, NtrC family, sensor kinase
MRSSDFLNPNGRLLIIDDNRTIHDDLRKVLLGERTDQTLLQDDEELLFGVTAPPATGFTIDSAYQGQEGLEMVERALSAGRPYALAIVDIRMPPGWDGVETIGHLLKVDPSLQTVVCTAYSDYTYADIQSRLGHTDNLLILKKPFDNIEVLQLAHTLTKKWQAERQAQARLADLENMVARQTAELKSANEQYRIIAETASDGIMTMDLAGAIRFANTAAGSMFGYSPLDLVGRNFSTLVPEHRRVLLLPRARESAVEVTGCHRLGHEMALEVSSADSRGSEGDQVWTVVLRDVTERKHREHQQAQAKKLEAIGRLSAGIAHEINTPIQFSAHNLEFIERSWDSMRQTLEQCRCLAVAADGQVPECSLAMRKAMSTRKFEHLWEQTPSAIREASEGIRRVDQIVRSMQELAHPGSEEKGALSENPTDGPF